MFYERFAELCKIKGISPSKAAFEMGISKASITNWKQNGYTPRSEILEKIADYFSVSIDYLLGREPKETDDEMIQLLQDIKDNPDKRMLFSLSQKATPEDVKIMVKFLEGITKSDNHE